MKFFNVAAGVTLLFILAVAGAVSQIGSHTLAMAGPASAPIALDAAFTYQGALWESGAAATGAYDFQFRLYDAAAGGSQVGSTITQSNVAVSDGRFTVLLDFGHLFDGAARYLEIGVRPAGSAADYTLLAPRQSITAAPYALYAATAGHAASADSIPWSGISDVPPDLGSDTLAELNCSAGQIAKWNGDNWQCGPDNNTTYSSGPGLSLSGEQFSVNFAGSGAANSAARSDHHHDDQYQQNYARTIVVGPVGDGNDAAANGAALLAAFAGITDATAANPYLLKIEPGVYDFESGRLLMKSHVDVEGSGEKVTILTGSGRATVNSGTVTGAADSELRSLTVENYGGNILATPIYNSGARFTLRNVTLQAAGGSSINQGIHNRGQDVTLRDVTILVDGSSSANSYGIVNDTTSILPEATLTIVNVHINLTSSIATVSTVAAISVTGTNTTISRLDSWNSAAVVTAPGGTVYGLRNVGGNVYLTNTRLMAQAATGYGVYLTSTSGAVEINHSQIGGSTAALDIGTGSHTVFIGSTLLDGGVAAVVNGSVVRCYASYDGDYQNSGGVDSCPAVGGGAP
jgi:hypothetical protein